MASKKVCIIGSGASGLTAIKCCIDEGVTPVCYEMSHDIGGLWRYEENEKEGACVYKSTVINTSKEMMCYSDFPIPKDFSNYMHNKKITEYMRLYSKEFNLLKHIQFHTEVTSCEYAKNYKETGQWKVSTRQRKTGEESCEVFDAVLVCVGHHAIPYYPRDAFPGVDKYKGTVIHSHSYRHPRGFEDKRIVVIGIGNSGGDISVELSKHASKVLLSTRRGAWVLKRLGTNGMPADVEFLTRFNIFMKNSLPTNFTNTFLEFKLNHAFDHAKYGLKPEHRFFSQHPMVNDALPNCILSGSVVVKGNIKEFTENGVVFEDGTYEEADVVIFATGYSFEFPFLDETVIKVRHNRCRLYKYMWPSHIEAGTLAVLGGIQPFGAINPISEIQCRWAIRVFKGLTSLPSASAMEFDVDQKILEMDKGFYKAQRHTIQVDYVTYMDEIADQIGVKPDVWKWLKKDFKLGMKLIFGPCTPYQYRLNGPGKWSSARDVIMTLHERIDFPLATRKVATAKSTNRRWLLILLALLCAVIWKLLL